MTARKPLSLQSERAAVDNWPMSDPGPRGHLFEILLEQNSNIIVPESKCYFRFNKIGVKVLSLLFGTLRGNSPSHILVQPRMQDFEFEPLFLDGPFSFFCKIYSIAAPFQKMYKFYKGVMKPVDGEYEASMRSRHERAAA